MITSDGKQALEPVLGCEFLSELQESGFYIFKLNGGLKNGMRIETTLTFLDSRGMENHWEALHLWMMTRSYERKPWINKLKK